MKKVLGVLTAMAVIGTTMLPVSAAAATSSSSDSSSVQSQAYTYKSVTVGGGGYCDDIIFNPTEKNLIYARTDMGGAYRWDATNKKWIAITDWIGHDDENYAGCDSLATDPIDTNRVYIQAGKYTGSMTESNGAILRSEDKGNTWEVVKLPFKVGGNMQGRYFGERLVVDPNSDNVLYMGTRCGNGLWKSTDYGKTWSQVKSFTAVGDYTPAVDDADSYDQDITGVVWVTPDKTSSSKGEPCKTLYVGVCNKKGENTVYVTKDGGETWNPVEGQPKYTVNGSDDDGNTVVKGILPVHGVLASNGVLYINYNDTVNVYRGDKGDVWKYDTKTGEWTKISPVSSDSSDDYFGYGGLSVDAQDPNVLVVSSDEQWWPDANIWRSTDGGKTWTAFWEWNGYPSRTLRYKQDISYSPWLNDESKIEPEAKTKIGWMIGNISIDPFNSDHVMWGTGATVYSTDNMSDLNSGGTVNFSCCTKGMEQYVAPCLISPTTGTAHLISGLYDVGGFVHTDLDTAPESSYTSPTFSGTTCIDYAELNPSKYVRVGNTTDSTIKHIGISNDTGENWYAVSDCWTPTNSDDNRCGGYVAMAADGSNIVWAPDNNTAACYSKDTGSSWTKCSGLPTGCIVASDRVNPKIFYAHSTDGCVYVSTDGGATFTKMVSTGMPEGTVNLKAMPGHEGDIWMAGGSDSGEYGIWHSTDAGKTWTKLSNVDKADTIGFGKAAPGQDYMALYMEGAVNGVRGFYRSDDAGATWIRINDDQHQFGLNSKSITGDPRIYGRVYVGTDGRGIQYGDIAGTTTSNSIITPTSASFDLNTSKQADIDVSVTLNGNTLKNIYNGDTALVKGTDYTVSSDGATVTILKAYLAKQSVGTVSLKFDFSAGSDQTLAVTVKNTTGVKNSTITPTSAAFDLNVSNQEDIPVSVTLNGNTLKGIYNGDTALVKGTDYTVSSDGATVTILKDYLAKQSVGTVNLKFVFSAGEDQTLAVTVSDTTTYSDSLISPDTAAFDLYKPADIPVTVNYNGNTLDGIYNGDTALVKGTDYTVSEDGTTVTILKDYLAKQSVGTVNLKFDFSHGTDPSLAVTVTDSTPVVQGSVEVQMFNGNTSSSTSGISPRFRVTNNGTTSIDLSKLKVRYYFTNEGSQQDSFWCDWSSVGSSNVTGNFVSMSTSAEDADTYLEIGFSSDAGTLAPGASVQIQARFAKDDWSNFNQSNDYSFNSTGTSYADWTKTTAYLGSTLEWGVEPK